MKLGVLIGALVLTGCGDAERSAPSRKTPYEPPPVPTCRLPDPEETTCRPHSVTDLSNEILDHVDRPPPDWREPRISVPFGFFTPAACVETESIPDLEEACATESYAADGRLMERVTRSADRVQRFVQGTLVEEAQLDGAGRVLRRTRGDRVDRWTYRPDGLVADHRWSFLPGHEEREVASCDGQIDQVVTNECGASPRQYAYDSSGRLAQITQARENFDLIEAFIYDDLDRMRVHSWGGLFSRHWDAEGRLIRETNGGSAVDGVTHHLQGPDGPARTWYVGHGNALHTGLTEYRYDQGRLTLWWSVKDSWSGVSGRNHTLAHEAHRLTYACAGGKVLEEIDSTLDGAADILLSWRRANNDSVIETRTAADGTLLEWKAHRFHCDGSREQ